MTEDEDEEPRIRRFAIVCRLETLGPGWSPAYYFAEDHQHPASKSTPRNVLFRRVQL